MDNSFLHKSQSVGYDEFYTQLDTIEKELIHYIECFRDKVIYCNCDDADKSNFVKWFLNNWNRVGIKKLIVTTIHKDEAIIFTNQDEYQVFKLDENGDFKSPQCIKLLQDSDIVVTNPPFSLAIDFFNLLFEYKKQFLILGNMNAITYKDVFKHIKDKELWCGISLNATKCSFIVPDEYENKNVFIEDGVRKARVNNAVWYTNLPNAKLSSKVQLSETYNDSYEHYDNYDGININKVVTIPYDFNGYMGVPITILDKLACDGFIHLFHGNDDIKYDIIKFRKGDDEKDLCVNGKCPYFRIIIKKHIEDEL